MQTIQIGTSGFYYDHWVGRFYPSELPKAEWLPYYAARFASVELNTTFYHLPRKKSLLHWLKATPEAFCFSLKAPRTITHARRLRDVEQEVQLFIHLIKPLKTRLGAILFQLPPSLGLDMPLLEQFLSTLPRGYRYALEFRHDSWLDDAVFGLLELHNVAFCIDDYEQRQAPFVATADFVYIRRHGESGRYRGSYDAAGLSALAGEITAFAGSGKKIYCYFNNDFEAAACRDAKALEKLLQTHATITG